MVMISVTITRRPKVYMRRILKLNTGSDNINTFGDVKKNMAVLLHGDFNSILQNYVQLGKIVYNLFQKSCIILIAK